MQSFKTLLQKLLYTVHIHLFDKRCINVRNTEIFID